MINQNYRVQNPRRNRKMKKEKMICNCGYEASNLEDWEDHIDICESVGTDEWDAITTR